MLACPFRSVLARFLGFTASSLLLAFLAPAAEQPFSASASAPASLERPLRYTPDGGDFVIENGGELFNRPLYGTNTAFRIDVGDRPEWSLYLPGRGGNLRLGLVADDGSVRWLHDATRIVSRYRPGAMRHEITELALGASASLVIDSLPCAEREGLVVRVTARGLATPLTLGWAYGGASGQRGKRDGDIGTEKVPIGEYFQFSPANAKHQSFTLGAEGSGSFTLTAPRATLHGVTSPASPSSLPTPGPPLFPPPSPAPAPPLNSPSSPAASRSRTTLPSTSGSNAPPKTLRPSTPTPSPSASPRPRPSAPVSKIR